MANPETANMLTVAGELTQSQAGPVFQPHVSHPFPFSAVANQLSSAAFSRSPNTSYYAPSVTTSANPAGVYDGGFKPSPFSQQLPSEEWNDRNANSYQMDDAVRPAVAPFDNFSSLFCGVMRPVGAGNSAQLYSGHQPVDNSSTSSFLTRPDGTVFGSQLQSSLSSKSWPPLPDVQRASFGQVSRYQAAPNDDLCSALMHNSAVGSDSVSSGSPVVELVDRANSPTQLQGSAYGCAVTLSSPSMTDLVASARRPYCPSPVDGLPLSRSLPAGVRFTCSQCGPSLGGVRFDSSSAVSPVSQSSLFQPASVPGGLDDRTSAGTGLQVELIIEKFFI